MKLSKKCFVIMIVASVLLLNVSIIAHSDESELSTFTDGFRIIVNNDGSKTCTIVGYESDIYTNIIPKELNGYIVTRIGNSAFKNANQITGEVIIPDTVISIGDEAFSGCTLLTKIKFGNNLVSIGNSAFSGCNSLERVDFRNIESIGDEAFSKCNGFEYKDIIFPTSIHYIGSRAFAETNIESLTFVNPKVPEVNNDTFSGYNGKKIIPNNCFEYVGEAWSYSFVAGISLMGDVNNDGKVNANDAAVVLDLYKNGNATEENMKVIDINRDGKINANDAALVLDIYKYGK